MSYRDVYAQDSKCPHCGKPVLVVVKGERYTGHTILHEIVIRPKQPEQQTSKEIPQRDEV